MASSDNNLHNSHCKRQALLNNFRHKPMLWTGETGIELSDSFWLRFMFIRAKITNNENQYFEL